MVGLLVYKTFVNAQKVIYPNKEAGKDIQVNLIFSLVLFWKEKIIIIAQF